MTARYQDRIERLRYLERCLFDAPADTTALRALPTLCVAYDCAHISATAYRRALQRDLEELVRQERIDVVNPGGKPLRYRRRIGADECEDDPLAWQWTVQQIRLLAAEAVPKRHLDRLWRTLLTNAEAPRLDESRLRIVPDTFRLQPAALHAGVLSAVIQSLIQRRALRVLYEKPSGERSEPVLHPQALVQRGPIAYLLALKEQDTAPVKLYALHRMIRAAILDGTPAREAAGFDLEQAITAGQLDFGSGDLIDLELRVRGYLVELLRDCPMAMGYQVEDEPQGSVFELRVRARVPSSGQLLRWLLGAGDNLEVLAPSDLRRIIAAQTRKAAALYRR